MCKEEQAERVEIMISLGSNTNQEANIKTAIEELKKEFNDIHFTEPIWTEPIGVQSDKYLNSLASFTTLVRGFKQGFKAHRNINGRLTRKPQTGHRADGFRRDKIWKQGG